MNEKIQPSLPNRKWNSVEEMYNAVDERNPFRSEQAMRIAKKLEEEERLEQQTTQSGEITK